MGCTESKSKPRKSRKLTKGSPVEIVVSITSLNASVKSTRSQTRLSNTKAKSLHNTNISDGIVGVKQKPTLENPTYGSDKLLWLVDLKSTSKKRKGLKDKMIESEVRITSRTSSLEEDDKSTDSILCLNLLRGNVDDDTAVEERGEEKRLPGSIRSVQEEKDFLSESTRKATTITERNVLEVLPENIVSDEGFECREKKRISISRRSITGEGIEEKEKEEEVELFSDSDSSWDWVSNMDMDADTDKEKLRIDGDGDGDSDGDVVDRSGVRKPKIALSLTGTRTGTGTMMEAEEAKAETFTYLSAQSDDVCDDDLQKSVSMTMFTSMCQLTCRGLPPPHHGPLEDENQHEMEVTGPEASQKHTTDHKSRLSSSSMAADTAVAVAEAEAMQQKNTSDMLLISSIIQAQDSSYKESEINSKLSASPARPIDKTDSIIPTSSPQQNTQEVSPHSMISYLPQSATIKSVIEPTKQRQAGPTMGEKQDKPEFPDACSHLLLPSSRESESSFIAMSMADSILSSSATALPTTPGNFFSKSVGATEHSNRAILPLPLDAKVPLYGRAFASKQTSLAESAPMSSSLSQYHITPLLSALLLPSPSPSTAPPLPAATRLCHSNSSPLSVTASTATSYSPSVSPSSNLQTSEIGAASVLPSPLTSPSSSVDGLSPRRGAVRAAAAASSKAGCKAPNVLTVDVQKIGEISSPVSSLSESSLPLSPYALFLQRNAAQAATAQQGLSLFLSLSHPALAAPVVKNAMLLSYEEEEAEYRAKHGTSWAPLSPIVYFAEPIEVDTRTRMTGNRKKISCGGHSGTGPLSGDTPDVQDRNHYDYDSEGDDERERERDYAGDDTDTDSDAGGPSNRRYESDDESVGSVQSMLTHENTVRNTVRNATTTMAPSAVITSQRNSVQRDWEKARDRDEQSLERERENNRERGRGRERAEAESLNSFGSRSIVQDQVQDVEMDIEMDMDECEGIRVASSSKVTGYDGEAGTASNDLSASDLMLVMLRLELELSPVVEDVDTDTMTPEKTSDSRQGMTQSQHLRTRSVSLPPVPSCGLSSSALHVDTARCSTRGRSVSAVTLIADSNPAPVAVSAVRASFRSTVCTDGETSITPTPAYLRAVFTEDACDKSEGVKQENAEKHRRTVLGPLCAATSRGSQELSSSSSSSSSTSSSYSTIESKYGRADSKSNSSLSLLLSPLPVAVVVHSGWSKEVSINARSSSLPCKYPGWIVKGGGEVDGNMGGVLKAQRAAEFKEGGGHVHDHVQGPPTAAVSVSRLFFENKVKEIADSISSSPRGSLTLPKREWGYSPYATPPKRSVYSSQSLSNLDQSDECSTSTSGDGGRQRERGREVVSLGNFAERKAFFQGNTYTPRRGHILAASTANTDGCPCSSAIPVCMRVPERQMQRVVSPRGQQQQHAFGGAHSPSHSQQQRDRERREERNITTDEGSMSALEAEVCIVKSVRVRDIVKSWSSVMKESSVVKSKKDEMAHVSQLHFVCPAE